MLFNDINPFVRQALAAQFTEQKSKYTFNEIKTVDCRLFYISAGQGKMRFDNEAYDFSAGTVILFGAGTPYTWEIDSGSVNYYSINFDYTQNNSHISRTFHPISSSQFLHSDIIESVEFDDETILNDPLVILYAPEFEKEMKRICTEYLVGNEYSPLLNSAYLKRLIVEIVKKEKQSSGIVGAKTTETVKKMIEYISKNYSKEIDYEILAQEFHFNPSYLNRIFKAYTGSSIYNFVLQYRLNMAIEMLSAQNLYVNQIAALCGFPNPYHFSKAFKKWTGFSPKQYKNQNKSKDNTK